VTCQPGNWQTPEEQHDDQQHNRFGHPNFECVVRSGPLLWSVVIQLHSQVAVQLTHQPSAVLAAVLLSSPVLLLLLLLLLLQACSVATLSVGECIENGMLLQQS
jgi:hypothetical protein